MIVRPFLLHGPANFVSFPQHVLFWQPILSALSVVLHPPGADIAVPGRTELNMHPVMQRGCLRLVCCFALVALATPWAVAAPSERFESGAVARLGKPKASSGALLPLARVELGASELERALFADAADGRLDEHSPLAASLIASGVANQARLDDCLDRFARLTNRLVEQVDSSSPPLMRARIAHEFMHRELLTGPYVLECSNVQATLERGQFNCVSSAIVFNHLARAVGLDARGIAVPGHVFSMVVCQRETFDVQTTCARWFDIRHDPSGSVAWPGSQAAASATGAQRRELSDVSLAAIIYYNEGVTHLHRAAFPQALAENLKALRLDPACHTAYDNLLAGVNNWAVELSRSGRYAGALDVLRDGLSIAPTHDLFQKNYVTICLEWAERAAGENRFGEAQAALDEAARYNPRDPRLDESRREIARRRQDGAAGEGRPRFPAQRSDQRDSAA